jgi:DNA-binding transcriptional MerR regulator
MAATWKVGELARRTGVSVRTLHYYDEIGLLTPSQHTESGHRLYTVGDVARLQQIRSLQQLGFRLEEIRACLTRSDFALLEVLERHLAQLREQMAAQQRLYQRLEALAASLRQTGEAPVEALLQTLEEMSMFEKYYTPEQMEYLKQRREQLGDEAIQAVEKEWPELIARVKAEMDAGTDPADPKVQVLAQRWRELVESFTGGDPGIRQSLRTMYEQEPTVHGMDTAPMRAMMEYINKALAAAGQQG